MANRFKSDPSFAILQTQFPIFQMWLVGQFTLLTLGLMQRSTMLITALLSQIQTLELLF